MSKPSLECGKCLLSAKLPEQCLTWSGRISIYVRAKHPCFLSFPCGSTLTLRHSIQQTFIEPLLRAGTSPDSPILCLNLLPHYHHCLIRSKGLCLKTVSQKHLLFLRGRYKIVFITGVCRNILCCWVLNGSSVGRTWAWREYEDKRPT